MKTGEGEVWSQRGGTPPSRAKTRWGNGAFHGPPRAERHAWNELQQGAVPFQCSPSGLALFHPPLTFRRDDRFRHPSRGHFSVLSLEVLDKLECHCRIDATICMQVASDRATTSPGRWIQPDLRGDEVVGKDREPQELPRAPPPPGPPDFWKSAPVLVVPTASHVQSTTHTENLPLLAPEFSSVSFTPNRQDVRRFMPALDRHLQPLYPAAYSHHRLWAQPEAAVATGRPTQVTRSVVLPLGPRGPEMHACRYPLPELAVSGREQLQCWLLVSGDC